MYILEDDRTAAVNHGELVEGELVDGTLNLARRILHDHMRI